MPVNKYKVWSYLLMSLISLCIQGRESQASSEAITTKEYGTLYVIEKQEKEVLPWRAGLNYGYEFGNPYSDNHGTTLVFEHSWGRYVWIGAQVTKYFSSSTALMKTLENDLRTVGIGQSIKTPNYSIYPTVTVVPLSGHLNFFGSHPLEMELGVRLGVGYIGYTANPGKTALMWSIRPAAHIDRHWSIQTGIGQEIESPFQSNDSLSRVRAEAGASYQF